MTASKSNKYSAEGTVAHSIAEELVTGKATLLQLTQRVGEVVEEAGFDVEITDAMIEGAIEYVDHIAEIRKRLKKPGAIVAKAEARVHASTIDPDEGWGTADYLLYQKGHELHVVDYKFGKGVVEAEDNKQGTIYLIGAQDIEAGQAFDKVFFHIVQPRVAESVTTWELPAGALPALRKELADAIAKTKDPNAKREAGKWCKFCPALAYCPEVGKGLEAAVKTAFTTLPAPPSKEVGLTSIFPEVKQLTLAQVAGVLDYEDVLDSFVEAVRARAFEELTQDANSVPGYKIVEGKANRVWGDEEAVQREFSMLGEEIYNKKLKSPAQLEKIAGKEKVAEFAIKPAGKLTVAKATDKRQAVTSVGQAKDVFGVIELPGGQKLNTPIGDADIFGDLMGGEKPKKHIWA